MDICFGFRWFGVVTLLISVAPFITGDNHFSHLSGSVLLPFITTTEMTQYSVFDAICSEELCFTEL